MSNGIIVKVDDKKKVATVEMFLNDRVETWVEFNLQQLDRLLIELAKARLQLEK